ncbi:MAG: hypothetical protein KY461_05210 [Actinobacteria bacterium]|nr:hypothetical protein [Actinomycetota bacterium]
MKFRTATVAVGVTVGLLVAATPPEGFTYEPTPVTIHNAQSCVQEGGDPRCVSTSYKLATSPGDSSVGSALTATPAASAIYYVDGAYSYDTYSPGEGVLGQRFVLDAAGNDITGQVTLRGFAGVDAAVDAAVSVQLSLRYFPVDADKPITRTYSVESTKVVMTPVDTVFEYTIAIPDEFDGVEAEVAGMKVAQRGINVLTSGFMDGEGGSYFVLPTLRAIPVT